MDADGNGVVTRAEAQTRAQAMFARMDANNDGKIDAADRAARMGQMFDSIDADKNGQISREDLNRVHRCAIYGRLRTQIFRKLTGSLLSPWACSLMGASAKGL